MKKIGVLTQYYNNKNIGGILQAYALIIFLRLRGYNAEQISFAFQTYKSESASIRCQLLQNHFCMKDRIFVALRQLKSTLIQWKLHSYLRVQNNKISTFANEITHTSYVYEDENIFVADEYYDGFIIGSDQVWNLDLLPHSAYYGEFVSPNKRVISYAASAGSKKFQKQAEKLFIKKLSRLNSISVREKTLKNYIELITDKKATVVLDPTFLLPRKEWLKISNTKPVPLKPYIFCYFLGGKSAWQRQIAQIYADQYGYEVVHLPYIMQCSRRVDRFLKGQGRYDVGPREFIALINGAQCVFTDSFHGLAFSINFKKNFYVFNRDDSFSPDSMSARITDTLDTFDLTQRYVIDQNVVLDNKPLDFTFAHKILEKEREKSISWLLNALRN